MKGELLVEVISALEVTFKCEYRSENPKSFDELESEIIDGIDLLLTGMDTKLIGTRISLTSIRGM